MNQIMFRQAFLNNQYLFIAMKTVDGLLLELSGFDHKNTWLIDVHHEDDIDEEIDSIVAMFQRHQDNELELLRVISWLCGYETGYQEH